MKFIFTDLEDEMKKTVEEVILKITDNKALRKLMCRYYLMYKYIIIIIIFFFFLFLFLLIYIQLYLYIIYIIICSMGGCPAEISFAAYAMLADHYLKGSSYPTVYKYKYYYY